MLLSGGCEASGLARGAFSGVFGGGKTGVAKTKIRVDCQRGG